MLPELTPRVAPPIMPKVIKKKESTFDFSGLIARNRDAVNFHTNRRLEQRSSREPKKDKLPTLNMRAATDKTSFVTAHAPRNILLRENRDNKKPVYAPLKFSSFSSQIEKNERVLPELRDTKSLQFVRGANVDGVQNVTRPDVPIIPKTMKESLFYDGATFSNLNPSFELPSLTVDNVEPPRRTNREMNMVVDRVGLPTLDNTTQAIPDVETIRDCLPKTLKHTLDTSAFLSGPSAEHSTRPLYPDEPLKEVKGVRTFEGRFGVPDQPNVNQVQREIFTNSRKTEEENLRTPIPDLTMTNQFTHDLDDFAAKFDQMRKPKIFF